MIEIDANKLFTIGFWCFLIAGIAKLLNLIINFSGFNTLSVIFTLADIIFTFVLAAFFKYNLSSIGHTESMPKDSLTEADYLEIDKQVKKLRKRLK